MGRVHKLSLNRFVPRDAGVTVQRMTLMLNVLSQNIRTAIMTTRQSSSSAIFPHYSRCKTPDRCTPHTRIKKISLDVTFLLHENDSH